MYVIAVSKKKRSTARLKRKHCGIISCFVDFNFLANIKSSEFISTFMVQTDVLVLKDFYEKRSSCLEYFLVLKDCRENAKEKREDKSTNQSKPNVEYIDY